MVNDLMEVSRLQNEQIQTLIAELALHRPIHVYNSADQFVGAAGAPTQGEKVTEAAEFEKAPTPPAETSPKTPTPPNSPPPKSPTPQPTPPKSPSPQPTTPPADKPPTPPAKPIEDTSARRGKKAMFGAEDREADTLIQETDEALAGGSKGTIAKKQKPIQFIDPDTKELVTINPDDPEQLKAQEAEVARYNELRKTELEGLSAAQQHKDEEAKAYKKIASAADKRKDATALQQSEIAILNAKRDARVKKHVEQWNEYVRLMSFRLYPEPITDLQWTVNDKKLDLTVFRGNSPLNFNVHRNATVGLFGCEEWIEMAEILKKKRKGKISTDMLEALERRFKWKQSVEKKFGVDLSLPLAEQGPLADASKKRKRDALPSVSKNVHDPTGEGRNLSLPKGVKFQEGKVIKEPEHGMFFTNNAQLDCFQRVNELHLCSTYQLILLRGTCQRTSNDSEMIALIELELEPRDKDLKKLKKAKLEELHIM